MMGLVGGGAVGTAENKKHWSTASIPQCSGYKEACNALREQGRSKTGIALLLHVKLAPMSAPGP